MDAIADGKFDDIKKDVAWFYVKDMFVYYIENGNHIIVHQVVDKVKEYTHILVKGHIVHTGDGSLVEKINAEGFENYIK